MPCLTHDGLRVWDTLAIAEYLNEFKPEARLFPTDQAHRAHCRSICGEMHSWAGSSQSAFGAADEYQGALIPASSHGPARAATSIVITSGSGANVSPSTSDLYLFGERPGAADAMYAPVCTRFLTYDVAIDPISAKYCQTIMALPHMHEWVAAAKVEPDELEELDVEF